MASDQIKEFFREKQARAISNRIDWSAKRDLWISAVANLSDTIENGYLGSADTQELVQVDRSQIKTISDPHVGTSSIPELTLAVGDEQVLFSPQAVDVVGAEGRVDVQGDRSEATLVRLHGDQWSLVLARTPKLQLVPLNEESFLQMLQSIMR